MKVFRKMRKNLLGDGKARKYLLYAIGEILLVMIGILLALQVNNRNNVKIEKKSENQFYVNFKHRISEDLDIINGSMAYNNNYSRQFQHAIGIIENDDRSEMDTLGFIALKLSKYSDFDRPANIYESIVNSGESKLIKNPEIINRIQILEESYMYFNRMEKIHYDLIISIVPELIDIIKYSNRNVERPNELYSYRFQNIFLTALNVMNEKDEVYSRAKKQITELNEMIDIELER